MSRHVTITMAGMCNADDRMTIHQAVMIQLSVGDKWVTDKPILVPPNPDDIPKSGMSQKVDAIAKAVHDACATNANGADIQNLTDVGEPTSTQKGSLVFSFGFDTDADEIDIGYCGARKDEHGKIVKAPTTQLQINVSVGAAPNDVQVAKFVVKEYDAVDAYEAWKRGGWHKGPGKTRHKPVPIPPEGGANGKLAFYLITGELEPSEFDVPAADWAQRRTIESWEMDAIAAGFYPLAFTELLRPFIRDWSEAMAVGKEQVSRYQVYHWSPFNIQHPTEEGTRVVQALQRAADVERLPVAPAASEQRPQFAD